MGFISIVISNIGVEIAADRRRIFQYLGSFGEQEAAGEPSSRVISSEDDGLIVEFITPLPLPFGINKTVTTVEKVTLQEPELINFEEVEGPFAQRRESITLDDINGSTRLQYRAVLGMKGWLMGWLLGILFVRPMLRRVIIRHFNEIKEKMEASTG